MELNRRRGLETIHKDKPEVKFVGVTFSDNSRMYDFKTIIPNLKHGDKVIISTSQGTTVGNVVAIGREENTKIKKYSWILARIDYDKIAQDHYRNLRELGIKQ